MSEELTKISLSRLAEMIRVREVSSAEVVGAHLRRIEALNPQLNAVVTLAPDALERAREADEQLSRGATRGALCGVPFTVKDTIETQGLRTTSGSRLRADFVPKFDAPAVTRMRAAGAIIVGKTNTSELALEYNADNPVFGRTNNPHSLGHTPGGSSGGCAAAVAAGLTPASLGSDLVGSIRIPAHFCGVVGLKPTTGRVPSGGHLPPTSGAFSLAACLGPLARSVEDVAMLFRVLTHGRVSPEEVGVHQLRVAWYTDDGVVPVGEETRQAVATAARALVDAGLDVSEERPPGVEHGARLWLELFSHVTQKFLRDFHGGRREDGGTAVQNLFERDALVEHRAALDGFLTAWEERDRRRAVLLDWMNTRQILVAPVGAVPAFAHGARTVKVGGKEVGIFRAFSYAQTFNAFDLPAVSVPAGRTSEGLPIGVQIVGRPNAENEVLAAARIVEQALGGWRMPEGVRRLAAHGSLSNERHIPL